MPGQGGKKRINGYFVQGEGTQGKHRLNITIDKKWFIEYDAVHPQPEPMNNGRPNGPSHVVRLDKDVDLVEFRLCDVADFVGKGTKTTTPPVGDENYDDWVGDPTSRGIGC